MRVNIVTTFSIAILGLAVAPEPARAQYWQTPFPSLTLGPGGTTMFSWEINNANPPNLGPGSGYLSGWSEWWATIEENPSNGHYSTGDLTWTATSTPGQQFSFAMQTLIDPTPVGTVNPGLMANFNPTQPYDWQVFYYEGIYTGPTDSATLTADTLFDTSQFQNLIGGAFSLALVQNSNGVGGAFDLNYTPVPEPGTLGLVAIGLLGVWRYRRQSR